MLRNQMGNQLLTGRVNDKHCTLTMGMKREEKCLFLCETFIYLIGFMFTFRIDLIFDSISQQVKRQTHNLLCSCSRSC